MKFFWILAGLGLFIGILSSFTESESSKRRLSENSKRRLQEEPCTDNANNNSVQYAWISFSTFVLYCVLWINEKETPQHYSKINSSDDEMNSNDDEGDIKVNDYTGPILF